MGTHRQCALVNQLDCVRIVVRFTTHARRSQTGAEYTLDPVPFPDWATVPRQVDS